ncbi:MAG TPA: HAD-IA family hydrolase [Candidatus Saccharimonadales bacterium]|jgi:putative hydrolase of the HAD superfamily|nr:HAD-IA family hydrolase [Candidatus Saccharimonadales bacterium]
MIRGIIFDCFGVLVGKGFGDVYAAAGGDPIKDNAFIDSMIIKGNRGEISDAVFEAIMAEKLGLSPAAFHAIALQEEQPNEPLFDYIRTELKPHYKIGLLSNAGTGVIENRISEKDRALFDVIVVSAEIGYQKPEPQAFQITIDRLGTTYDETIFIDDLAIFTEPAKLLGLHALQYKGLDLLKQQLQPLLK